MMRVHHQVPKSEEPEVGVRGEREPVEQEWQELGHEPRAARQPGGEVFDGGPGAGGVGETEGVEPSRHGFSRHDRVRGALRGGAGLGLGRSGRHVDGAKRFQQRAEEDSLVDGPDLALATAQRVIETGRGRCGHVVLEAQHQGEASPGEGVGGYRVRLFLLDELQPVLDRPQEAVRVTERSSVVGSHVPGSGELCERIQCRALPDLRVVAAVHQLEELDGELDVADPPRTPLDLSPSKAAPGHDPLGPGLHRPHRGQLVRAVMPPPYLLDSGPFEPLAQLGVAGDGTGLQ